MKIWPLALCLHVNHTSRTSKYTESVLCFYIQNSFIQWIMGALAIGKICQYTEKRSMYYLFSLKLCVILCLVFYLTAYMYVCMYMQYACMCVFVCMCVCVCVCACVCALCTVQDPAYWFNLDITAALNIDSVITSGGCPVPCRGHAREKPYKCIRSRYWLPKVEKTKNPNSN